MKDLTSDVTIVVKEAALRAQAEKIRNLAAKINSRSYRLEFDQGEGAFVTELKEMSTELRNVGSALESLMLATAERLDSAAADFTAADERTAGFYRGGE